MRCGNPGTPQLRKRDAVLQAAYLAHSERFKGEHPTPPKLPTVVGINLPKPQPPEPSHDLIQTPALLTNLHTEVSHSH